MSTDKVSADKVSVGDVPDDPIEDYLDHLLLRLRGSPRQVRRMLTEAEHHLRDAAAEEIAAGATPEEAAERAVARFGTARVVAARSNNVSVVPLPEIARQLMLVGMLLGGIGLLAVGVSGAVSAIFGSTLGARFVAGDLPGVTYTPARCLDFLEYAPRANSCLQAAAIHHYGEVVLYRLAAGVLGVLACVMYLALRRRWQRGAIGAFLTPVLGTTAFGLATVVLAGQTANSLAQGRDAGAGQWASAAVVSLPLAIGFGVVLLRTLRRPMPMAR